MRSVEEIEDELEVVLCFGIQGYNMSNAMGLEEELREAKREQRREEAGMLHVIPDTNSHIPVDKNLIRAALRDIKNG